MHATERTLCRVAALLLLAAGLAAKPALPAQKLSCLAYAPAVVELFGVLQREGFAEVPREDLYVDPNEPELGGDEEDQAIGDTPAMEASQPPPIVGGTAQPAAVMEFTDPAFIGPPTPAQVEMSASLRLPDPVLLQARPPKRPPKLEYVWVLTLRSNTCVLAESTDLLNTTERKVRKIQLVVDKMEDSLLRSFRKKKVVVQGQLFHGVSRRHYLPVLINVETIRPPEWTPALTQLQPLPAIPR